MDSPTGIEKTEGLNRACYEVCIYCSFFHIVSVKRKQNALQLVLEHSLIAWNCLEMCISNLFRAGMTKLSIDAVASKTKLLGKKNL